MPVLGVNFLLLALGSTHYAIAQKRIDFRTPDDRRGLPT